jgi:hypothetical protein
VVLDAVGHRERVEARRRGFEADLGVERRRVFWSELRPVEAPPDRRQIAGQARELFGSISFVVR